ELRVRIMQGGRPAFSGQPRPVRPLAESTPPKRIITGGTLTLGQLAAGGYTLEVTLTHKLRKEKSPAVGEHEIKLNIATLRLVKLLSGCSVKPQGDWVD